MYNTCTCVYVHVYVYVRTYVCMYVYMFMDVCMHTKYACMYGWMDVFMFEYVVCTSCISIPHYNTYAEPITFLTCI